MEHDHIASDRALLEAADAMSRQYFQKTMNDFVRVDHGGAKHSLERDFRLSPINTAALYRVFSQYPTLFPGIDCSLWVNSVIVPEIERLVRRVKIKDPRLSEYEVYCLTQMLLAVEHPGAQKKVRDWLRAYLGDWFNRRTDLSSVFLVYLAVSAMRDLQDMRGPVERFADTTIERQLRIASGHGQSPPDAIDLGLALSLGRVAPQLAQAAYDALNKACAISSVWTNRQALVRLGERAVGCSSFEACAALLRGSSSLFRFLRPAFAAHLAWLRDQEDTLPWKVSEIYFRDAVHETWFNCLLVEFINKLREHSASSLQTEVRATLKARGVEQGLKWTDLVLDEPAKRAIGDRMITPARALSDGARLDYSTAILFGPPGTAKTTVAEVVAKELDWPLVSLGVADFLREGLDKVFATSLDLFSELNQLDRCVVLLDEVEGVFAQRTEERDLRQKFLTSALLPPLKNVRERGRILLFIATNHVSEFDTAIRRQGRIDLIIPVGPPDRGARSVLLTKIVGLSPNTSGVLAGLMRDGSTIAEVLAVKRLKYVSTPDPTAEAQGIFDLWKAKFKKVELGDAVLDDFRKECEQYARYD